MQVNLSKFYCSSLLILSLIHMAHRVRKDWLDCPQFEAVNSEIERQNFFQDCWFVLHMCMTSPSSFNTLVRSLITPLNSVIPHSQAEATCNLLLWTKLWPSTQLKAWLSSTFLWCMLLNKLKKESWWLNYVPLEWLTYSFKCLDAMLAAIRDVHTLCLNIRSAFLTTTKQRDMIHITGTLHKITHNWGKIWLMLMLSFTPGTMITWYKDHLQLQQIIELLFKMMCKITILSTCR